MAEQRLIDAEALKKTVFEGVYFSYQEKKDLCKYIDAVPTIEAKPVVHAHWEKYDDSEFCYCSHCGKPAAEDNDVSWHGYCPVCGAQMDEEAN